MSDSNYKIEITAETAGASTNLKTAAQDVAGVGKSADDAAKSTGGLAESISKSGDGAKTAGGDVDELRSIIKELIAAFEDAVAQCKAMDENLQGVDRAAKGAGSGLVASSQQARIAASNMRNAGTEMRAGAKDGLGSFTELESFLRSLSDPFAKVTSLIGRIGGVWAVAKGTFDMATWATEQVTGLKSLQSQMEEFEAQEKKMKEQWEKDMPNNQRSLNTVFEAKIKQLTDEFQATLDAPGQAAGRVELAPVRDKVYSTLDTVRRLGEKSFGPNVYALEMKVEELKKQIEAAYSDPNRFESNRDQAAWRRANEAQGFKPVSKAQLDAWADAGKPAKEAPPEDPYDSKAQLDYWKRMRYEAWLEQQQNASQPEPAALPSAHAPSGASSAVPAATEGVKTTMDSGAREIIQSLQDLDAATQNNNAAIVAAIAAVTRRQKDQASQMNDIVGTVNQIARTMANLGVVG